MRLIAIAVLLLVLVPFASAQDGEDAGVEEALVAVVDRLREPRTAIERLQERESALIVSRWERVGVATALRGDAIAVIACSATDETAGQTLRGVALGNDVRGARGDDVYVDEGEVGALLRSMDAIIRIKRDAATYRDFDAHYETPGGLIVRTFASTEAQGGVAVAIELNARRPDRAFYAEFTTDQLVRLRDLIDAARDVFTAPAEP